MSKKLNIQFIKYKFHYDSLPAAISQETVGAGVGKVHRN